VIGRANPGRALRGAPERNGCAATERSPRAQRGTTTGNEVDRLTIYTAINATDPGGHGLSLRRRPQGGRSTRGCP